MLSTTTPSAAPVVTASTRLATLNTELKKVTFDFVAGAHDMSSYIKRKYRKRGTPNAKYTGATLQNRRYLYSEYPIKLRMISAINPDVAAVFFLANRSTACETLTNGCTLLRISDTEGSKGMTVMSHLEGDDYSHEAFPLFLKHLSPRKNREMKETKFENVRSLTTQQSHAHKELLAAVANLIEIKLIDPELSTNSQLENIKIRPSIHELGERLCGPDMQQMEFLLIGWQALQTLIIKPNQTDYILLQIWTRYLEKLAGDKPGIASLLDVLKKDVLPNFPADLPSGSLSLENRSFIRGVYQYLSTDQERDWLVKDIGRMKLLPAQIVAIFTDNTFIWQDDKGNPLLELTNIFSKLLKEDANLWSEIKNWLEMGVKKSKDFSFANDQDNEVFAPEKQQSPTIKDCLAALLKQFPEKKDSEGVKEIVEPSESEFKQLKEKYDYTFNQVLMMRNKNKPGLAEYKFLNVTARDLHFAVDQLNVSAMRGLLASLPVNAARELLLSEEGGAHLLFKAANDTDTNESAELTCLLAAAYQKHKVDVDVMPSRRDKTALAQVLNFHQDNAQESLRRRKVFALLRAGAVLRNFKKHENAAFTSLECWRGDKDNSGATIVPYAGSPNSFGYVLENQNRTAGAQSVSVSYQGDYKKH